MENEQEKADISDASIKSNLVAATEESESKNTSQPINATMQNASPKTWTSAELEALQFKTGLVAGALSDFQGAGGLVAVEMVNYKNNDKPFTAIKLYLVAEGLSLVAENTQDGIDISLVAATK